MKQAYLTIDDSPSADFGRKVEYLRNHHLPAVFFCTGELMAQRFDEVVSAIEGGFVIGNHSYSHPHFSDLTTDEACEQIARTDALIERLYAAAGTDRTRKYFRFPYFDRGGHGSGAEYEARNVAPHEGKMDAIQRFLSELGYEKPRFKGINAQYFEDKDLLERFDVPCTFDQAEYYLGSPHAPWGLSEEQAILNRIEEDFPFEGRTLNCLETNDIVLVHDHSHTTDLFFRIIDRYLEKGIQFQRID